MSFERFGKVSYTKETKVADFVHHLEEGKIMGTKCKNCGALNFPPRADCANCLSSDVEWVELSGKGKLITYTTAHFAPVGFEDDAPYTLALVELEEGPRVLAHLSKEISEEETKIGMTLELVSINLPEGRASYELRKR
jgi:hypothetical protein